MREVVDADQSGYHFASDVLAKPPSGVASDVAGRAHPCVEHLRGSNHGPGNVETWRLLDDGYGKQLDIIYSIILEILSNRFPCTGRIMKLAGEST